MKIVQLIKVLMLVVATATCSIPAFAQQNNQQKQIPEGKWVLEPESIYAFTAGCNHSSSEEQGNSHVDMAAVNAVLYPELQVGPNSILLTSSHGNVQATYVYDDMGGIRFDSPTFPLSPGGNVIAGKLYVQQRIVNLHDESETIYISLIYKRKK